MTQIVINFTMKTTFSHRNLVLPFFHHTQFQVKSRYVQGIKCFLSNTLLIIERLHCINCVLLKMYFSILYNLQSSFKVTENTNKFCKWFYGCEMLMFLTTRYLACYSQHIPDEFHKVLASFACLLDKNTDWKRGCPDWLVYWLTRLAGRKVV